MIAAAAAGAGRTAPDWLAVLVPMLVVILAAPVAVARLAFGFGEDAPTVDAGVNPGECPPADVPLASAHARL